MPSSFSFISFMQRNGKHAIFFDAREARWLGEEEWAGFRYKDSGNQPKRD